jgi:hypothetical protein
MAERKSSCDPDVLHDISNRQTDAGEYENAAQSVVSGSIGKSKSHGGEDIERNQA